MPSWLHQSFLRSQPDLRSHFGGVCGVMERALVQESDPTLAPGDFLTSCVTLGSFGLLSLSFLICKVETMILTSQGRCEKAAENITWDQALWPLARG